MFTCRLCGLHIEAIPKDAVLIGRLHRFEDGSFHYLRKSTKTKAVVPPRDPNREPPREPPPMGIHACDVPAFEVAAKVTDVPSIAKTEKQEKKEKKKAEKKEVTVVRGESSMQLAFRLGLVKT